MKPHISKSSRAAAQKAQSRRPVVKRSRPKAERARGSVAAAATAANQKHPTGKLVRVLNASQPRKAPRSTSLSILPAGSLTPRAPLSPGCVSGALRSTSAKPRIARHTIWLKRYRNERDAGSIHPATAR